MSGAFELAADEPACAFLAFGGHSRAVDAGPARKLALYLAEHRPAIAARFDIAVDELVILHETTRAGAWLGGVAYPRGAAVAGAFTLDGAGARVTVRKPRDPAALKVRRALFGLQWLMRRSTPRACAGSSRTAAATARRRRAASSPRP